MCKDWKGVYSLTFCLTTTFGTKGFAQKYCDKFDDVSLFEGYISFYPNNYLSVYILQAVELFTIALFAF